MSLWGLPIEEQKRILRARLAEEKKQNALPTAKSEHAQDTNINISNDRGSAGTSDKIGVKEESPSNGSGRASSPTVKQETVKPSQSADVSQWKSPSGKVDSPTPPRTSALLIHPAYAEERRRTSSNAKPSTLPRSLAKSESSVTVDALSASIAPTNNQINASDYPFTEKLPLPNWIHGIRISDPAKDRSLVALLQKLVPTINTALKARGAERETYFNTIREYLHQFEHKDVDAVTVKKSRLLEVKGLQQLFLERKDGFKLPHDIRADAKMLYHKWVQEDFSADIMRGLEWGRKSDAQGKGRISTSFKQDYKNRVSWKFFGTGDLVSGQWWPVLLACMRDGAHGSPEAGISRLDDDGATSVLISNAHYEDVDNGNVILYCGTEGVDGKLTHDTKALHGNIKSKNPVRVLRSARLPEENRLRPDFGFRYDGVYRVKSYEVLDASKPHHRFRLERLPNQDPIRWSGIGARPTKQDKEAYQRHRAKAGMIV